MIERDLLHLRPEATVRPQPVGGVLALVRVEC
jgi:hypothetical protein